MAKKKQEENQGKPAGGPAEARPDKKKEPAVKKASTKKNAAKAVEKGPGIAQKIKQFFREVRIELKKVTWPSRKETVASTSVVLVLVVIVAVYLGLVDVGLSRALRLLFQ